VELRQITVYLKGNRETRQANMNYSEQDTRSATNDRDFAYSESPVNRATRITASVAYARQTLQLRMHGWLRNISAIGFLISALLSAYLLFQVHQKNANIALLIRSIELRDKRIAELDSQIADLVTEARHKARVKAEAERVNAWNTPIQFGYYLATDESPLQPLEVLSTEKRDLPLDFPKYMDKPAAVAKGDAPAHLVLYDRIFSVRAPSTLFIHVVAKVRGEEAWVVSDRGFEAQVFPRTDSRDILDVFVPYKPGRYAIELDRKYYSFSIDGPNDDLNFCVQRRRGVFQNKYITCKNRVS
jgi:hypothetical protein